MEFFVSCNCLLFNVMDDFSLYAQGVAMDFLLHPLGRDQVGEVSLSDL